MSRSDDLLADLQRDSVAEVRASLARMHGDLRRLADPIRIAQRHPLLAAAATGMLGVASVAVRRLLRHPRSQPSPEHGSPTWGRRVRGAIGTATSRAVLEYLLVGAARAWLRRRWSDRRGRTDPACDQAKRA